MAKIPDKKVSAFIVPRDAKVFLLVKNKKKMGWTIQPTALVTFDNVKILARLRIENMNKRKKIMIGYFTAL